MSQYIATEPRRLKVKVAYLHDSACKTYNLLEQREICELRINKSEINIRQASMLRKSP